jgi:hypothetical protein
MKIVASTLVLAILAISKLAEFARFVYRRMNVYIPNVVRKAGIREEIIKAICTDDLKPSQLNINFQ